MHFLLGASQIPGENCTVRTVEEALAQAGSRDISSQSDKKNYAERFSRALAEVFANQLRPNLAGILPDEHGKQQESRARTSKGVKKLDVNYSTPELGLGLGLSIKTLNFPDGNTKRYTKNYTRIDNELRAEAKDYHSRQPFAVMVAVLFLPTDSCSDGLSSGTSSFGAAVRTFRFRAGRENPRSEDELFERMFICLYESNVSHEQDNLAGFFDVMSAPPKLGKPNELLSLTQVIAEIMRTYDQRNNPPFLWAG